MTYENMALFRFSGNERQAIIYRILEYYRLHLADFPEIKSLEVLHAVFLA
jgi:DNA repair protein RecO (recombination protein O)